MSPVARACVPPQSSVEKSPKETTRTRSPYFSPNIAIAPAAIASRYDISRTAAGAFASIQSFTRSSIVLELARASSGASWVKSKRSRSGATSEPFCIACGPSTLAQRRVQQVRARVVAHGRRARLGVDA